jgi:Ni,Fe-hydrogenase III large subunit
MTALADIIAQGQAVEHHRPWPRVVLGPEAWNTATSHLAAGDLTLLGLWGEAQTVHMALATAPTPDRQRTSVAVISLDCPDGTFPSVGRHHPPAIRLERTIQDLFGLVPADAPDTRPWLDHGRWGTQHPLGKRSAAEPALAYPFLSAEGESLHQILVGPVHAGIIEPGHFRFTASGEAVVRLEERLGYVHKGIESLMTGATIERAARLAGHVSGDSTVACAFAFARAVENALDIKVPRRAIFLRALMAELERLANHLGDIGAVCNDASFALMHTHCGVLRERVLRASDAAFGHRLMMDRVVPGGVATDLTQEGIAGLRRLTAEVRRRFPALAELYENTASLQDRTVGTGVLSADLARQFGAGGFVGRASGRDFDARRDLSYAPYDTLDFEVLVLTEGDVDARVSIRIREIGESLSLIRQMLARLPDGAVLAGMEMHAGEGLAIVEGFRGDILVWVRIDGHGRIARCHLRDPSSFQWPLLEAAVEGNIVADFPLCNKSFNCSYSGHDL